MYAFLFSLILLASGGSTGGFTEFYNKYLNIPGFEAWKFVNLAIFVFLLVWFAKYKKLPEKFKAKREAIRAELIKAEQDKQAALAQLTAAEAKLAAIEVEKKAVLKKAKEEAEAEAANIANQTEHEIGKMREQAETEVSRLANQTKAELRRYSAEESIRLAEEKLRSKIDANRDAALVGSGIQSIGGLN
jgi:F0F1-type ATP synthase membrane subunit b/b'